MSEQIKVEARKYCQCCSYYDKKKKICIPKNSFINRKGTCHNFTRR